MSLSIRNLGALLWLGTLATLPYTVSAQQSVSILLVNADRQPLVGSVVGTVNLTSFHAKEELTATVGCSLGGTTLAICTASGSGAAAGTDAAALPSGAITTTLGANEIHFTQIPITGGKATAAQSTGTAATTRPTGASTKKPSTTGSITGSTTGRAAASSGPQIGQAQPSPSGSTGGAKGLGSECIVALLGAAALSAMISSM
ncbi:MAG: hypothetical protein L6R39_002427 [Caloplaca ligustica]|nr:MAG: hypothetical protein L6R39_002427 [Caloplaca ligustica]